MIFFVSLAALICMAMAFPSGGIYNGRTQLPLHARGGKAHQYINASPSKYPSVSTDQWFNQSLTHVHGDPSTFLQRYFVDESYWNKHNVDAPVFLFICGEGPCHGTPGGFVSVLAKEHGAIIVALEHRFYGKSVPGNDFSVSNLKLLTVENALGDLANFIVWFKAERHLTGKVITVGGSYPGALSSFFRFAYPQLTDAAISSSGVVNAIVEFSGFDEQISASVVDECSEDMRTVVRATDRDFKLNAIKTAKLFGASPDIIASDFAYMVADSLSMAVQYGSKDVVCSAISKAILGGENPTIAFANFTSDFWGKDFGGGAFYDTTKLKTDKTFARSWRWQKCHQLGYLQNAPSKNSIRSHLLTLKTLMKQCHDIFGNDIDPVSNAAIVNARYGGDHPHATDVIYANASDDPWQRASASVSVKNRVFSNCDGCGHCCDLNDSKGNKVIENTQKKEKDFIASILKK